MITFLHTNVYEINLNLNFSNSKQPSNFFIFFLSADNKLYYH